MSYLAISPLGANNSGKSSSLAGLSKANNNVQEEKLLEQKIKGCYAALIVQPETTGVVDAENILGKPDSKYAQILPGGELTFKIEMPLSASIAYNNGVIIAKDEGDYSLAALVHLEDSLVWTAVMPGPVPGGFRLTYSNQIPNEEVILKITNIGNKPVYIDAVVGFCEKSK